MRTFNIGATEQDRQLPPNGTPRTINSPDEIATILQEALAENSKESLPEAAVILRSSALIHQLRASAGGLTGATFLSPSELAGLVFLSAGLDPGAPADSYLAPILEALIASPVLNNKLCYFKVDQLRTGAGYAEALASTIEELSGAGLNSERLEESALRIENSRDGRGADRTTIFRLRDIATVWRSLQPTRTSRFYLTSSDLLTRAAELLSERPALYPFRGPTIALFDEQTSNAALRFLAAIPRLTTIHFRAFPERKKLQQRLAYAEAILLGPRCGGESPRQPSGSADRRASSRELEILKNRLFHPLGELSDIPPDSPGADGSVHLEEHAGVEEELQSAVEWVSRQVLEHKVPLERIAILLPAADPYAVMLVERLAALPFGGELPVYVASGVPAKTQADGSRLLALLEALEAHLSADSVVRLLPYLRLSKKGDAPDEDDAPGHLTYAESLELAYSCGTLGGLAGRPEGAGEWTGAMVRRARALERIVDEQKRAGVDDPEPSGHARGLSDNERLLSRFRGLIPAFADLAALHDLLLREEPVEELWPGIDRFAEKWVLLPPADHPVLPLIRRGIRPLLSFQQPNTAGSPGPPQAPPVRLSGPPALRVIKRILDGARLPVGCLGEPRIFIAPLAYAPGLVFDSVRVMGLCEGAWPTRPLVDPILPDIDRALLEPAAGFLALPAGTDDEARTVPRRDDRPLHQLCDFYRVIQGVRSRLVLSFARQSVDGTIKEPSSVFLEAATALRRPVGGRPSPPVPGLKEIRLGYFGPAREAENDPPRLGAFTTALRVSARPDPGQAVLPSRWITGHPGQAPKSLDLSRLRDLILDDHRPAPGPFDGLLPADWPMPRLHGLTKASPLSASRISAFIGCPHKYLFENILHWTEPPARPLTREVDALAYGNLLHGVAEEFFSRHGPAFTSSRRAAPEWSRWRTEALTIIDRRFGAFLEEYPLLSGRVREEQRKRLRRDFLRLLDFEWRLKAGLRFRAAEFAFGDPEPVVLSLAGRRIFVHGYIDRLDEFEGRLYIRDLKTGKRHPREKDEEAPSPGLDVQLAIYALAMNAHHRKDPANWPPVGGVAYFYTDPRGAAERAFVEDLGDLLAQGSTWLSTVAEMIAGRAFPRTPDPDDCQYCPFTPICKSRPRDATGDNLQAAGPLVRRFMDIKGAPGGGDDEVAEEQA